MPESPPQRQTSSKEKITGVLIFVLYNHNQGNKDMHYLMRLFLTNTMPVHEAPDFISDIDQIVMKRYQTGRAITPGFEDSLDLLVHYVNQEFPEHYEQFINNQRECKLNQILEQLKPIMTKLYAKPHYTTIITNKQTNITTLQ